MAIEVAHIAIGLFAAAVLTAAARWAYPLGAGVIGWCGIAAMAVTVLLGIGPLRQAWRADRGRSRA